MTRSGDRATRLYRSPEYFDYLHATEDGVGLDVLTVTDASEAGIVGIVPVRQMRLDMPFSVGSRTPARMRLHALSFLGSEPMIPQNAPALDALFAFIDQRFGKVQIVDMKAVALDSHLWRYIQSSSTIRARFHTHVMHGLRDFHSVAVPKSLADYSRRLTRKRRYNFMRQQRLLETHLGAPLELLPIETAQQLPQLYKAIEALDIPPAHRALLSQDQYLAATERDLLQCFVLRAGNRIIGLAAGWKRGGICHIDRLFHDPALGRFSPGTTLWQLVLRYLIEEATFTEVVLGFGNPSYRFHATNTVTQRGRILLFRRSLANRCRIFLYDGYTRALNRVKLGFGGGALSKGVVVPPLGSFR